MTEKNRSKSIQSVEKQMNHKNFKMSYNFVEKKTRTSSNSKKILIISSVLIFHLVMVSLCGLVQFHYLLKNSEFVCNQYINLILNNVLNDLESTLENEDRKTLNPVLNNFSPSQTYDSFDFDFIKEIEKYFYSNNIYKNVSFEDKKKLIK